MNRDPENDAGSLFKVLLKPNFDPIKAVTKNWSIEKMGKDDEHKTCQKGAGKRKCYSLEVQDLQ